MNQKDIEMQLWEYIDGQCSEAAKADVKQMIATDVQWKNLYEELTALHAAIPVNMSMEQPSMRFTKNVMEAVARTGIAPATRQYINIAIIKTIAGFFIFSLIAFFVYALTTIDRKQADTRGFSMLSFNNSVISILSWITLVIGLLLLDTLLHRKKIHKGLL